MIWNRERRVIREHRKGGKGRGKCHNCIIVSKIKTGKQKKNTRSSWNANVAGPLFRSG